MTTIRSVLCPSLLIYTSIQCVIIMSEFFYCYTENVFRLAIYLSLAVETSYHMLSISLFYVLMFILPKKGFVNLHQLTCFWSIFCNAYEEWYGCYWNDSIKYPITCSTDYFWFGIQCYKPLNITRIDEREKPNLSIKTGIGVCWDWSKSKVEAIIIAWWYRWLVWKKW